MKTRGVGPVGAVILFWLIMMLLGSTGIHWAYYINQPWVCAAVVFVVVAVLG